MSPQLHRRHSADSETHAHRVLRRLEEFYPLACVSEPAARVECVSAAWQAAAAEELHGSGPAPGSEFCGRSDFAKMLERMPKIGGLLRTRLALPGSKGPSELSLFCLKTEAGPSACQVAIARPGGRPATSTERSALLDDAPQAILAVDAEGFVAYANPAAEQLLGLGSEALQGCALAALAQDSEGLESLLKALEGSTSGEFALQLRSPQAGGVATIARAAQRRGEAAGVVLTLRPDDRPPQSELARRNDELEHCVNTLAHDLRSPLVALLGFSRLLRQDFGDRLDDTGEHFIDRIEQAARTMESLIHDVLELSRIGKPGERARLIDPRAVLLQLAAELKPRLDEGGIRLSLPENPPLVFCDHTRLYQVFSNLIGNAVDHMGECEDRRITVSIAELTRHHQLTVSDSGRGIEPTHREKIFEVFQTVGARRGGHRGTGMGLAIVRKIAEAHGGRAWVESQPGNGSAFHVTFPRR
jgi:signal transduction histidine kinase